MTRYAGGKNPDSKKKKIINEDDESCDALSLGEKIRVLTIRIAENNNYYCDEREPWSRIGFAIFNEMNKILDGGEYPCGDGEIHEKFKAAFDDFSQVSSGYDYDGVESFWEDLLRSRRSREGGLTMGSIIHICQELNIPY